MNDFNYAKVKAVCVEAGMNALRRNSTFINHEDFIDGIKLKQRKNLILIIILDYINF